MPPAAGRSAQAQRRGRRVLRGSQRAQHEEQGLAALRRQVQAAQAVAAHVVGARTAARRNCRCARPARPPTAHRHCGVERSHNNCDGSRPSAASASACGGWGGCSSTMRRDAQAASAGRSRRISPMPGCCSSRSIRVPPGQPPPGNWPDKVAWPVSMQRVSACASCDARHSDGCNASGAARMEEGFMAVITMQVLYKRTVLFETGLGKRFSFCLPHRHLVDRLFDAIYIPRAP